MAHNNYFLDISYWQKVTHNPENPHAYNLATGSLIDENDNIAYLFNPAVINDQGFSKNSSNLTLAQVNLFRTTLNPSGCTIPNGSDYLLSKWEEMGWGSTLATVLENYNTFVENTFVTGSNKLSISPELDDLVSHIVSGNLDGQLYFLPILVWGNQSSENPIF